MDKNFEEKLKNYREAVARYISEDLTRHTDEREKANDERRKLENRIDEEDRGNNALYQRSLERLSKANENIKNTKKAAKYSLEKVITLLKERNSEIETKYMNKKTGQIQFAENEKQRLEYEIATKEAKITQTQELIAKYAEMGDWERKSELEAKVQNIRAEVIEKRNKQKEYTAEIEECKTFEEEYNKNIDLIRGYKQIAKVHDIELELQTVSQQNKDEQNKDKQNKDKQNKDEQNKDKQNKDEQNKDKQNKDEQNKEEQNKDEQNKDEQNKDEQNKDKQNKDKQNKDKQNKEEQNNKPDDSKLTKITIKIGENAKRTSEIKRGENVKNTEPQKLDDEETHYIEETLIPSQPKADEWVIRELVGSCVRQKIITIEEAKEQYDAYVNIMNGVDIEQNKSKLKIEIEYDLKKRKNLKGLSEDDKIDIRANARKAEKLGIGKAKVEWWRRIGWNIADAWENKDFSKLLPGKKETSLGIPERTSRSEEVIRMSIEQRNRAFRGGYELKKEKEVEEEYQTEQDKIIETYDFHKQYPGAVKEEHDEEAR